MSNNGQGAVLSPETDKRKKRRIYVSDEQYKLIYRAMTIAHPKTAEIPDMPQGEKVSLFCVAAALAVIQETAK